MDRGRFDELLRAVFLLCATWTLVFALPRVLNPWFDRGGATALSFLAVAGLLVASRSSQQDRPLPRAGALLLLGGIAGYVSLPAWVAVIATVGIALNLDPISAPAPGTGDPVFWVTTLLLAPAFEEILYRERLLSALRPVIGASAAIGSRAFCSPFPMSSPGACSGL